MDPWDWSIDEVVVNLCGSTDLWTDRPNSKLPDPTQFEVQLRQNDINGATLLVHVDVEVLKNDLQVKSLGERAAVFHAIEILRTRSPQYVSCMATIESRQNRIKSEAHARSSFTPPQSNPAPSPALATFIRDSPVRNLATPKPSVLEDYHEPELPFRTAEIHQDPKLRSGEYLVTKGGVKRRKLQLVPELEVPNVWIGQKTRLSQPERKFTYNYLGRNSIPIDTLFFNDAHCQSLDDGPDGSDATEFTNFLDNCGQFCIGEKIFVHRRMQNFLRSEDKILDKSRVVRFPYPERLAKDRTGRSAILFELSDGHVSVTKRDATLIDLEIVDSDNNSTEHKDVDHSWDYLLSKYPTNGKGDQILPLYDKLESEGEYDDDMGDETEPEDTSSSSSNVKSGQERRETENRNIIAEEISKFRSGWTLEKLPRRENTAWTVWKRFQGRGRSEVIHGTKLLLETLGARLQKLVNELSSHHWNNPAELRKQCGCLQPTVEDLQDQEWKLRLWESAKPPPRLFKAHQKQRTVSSRNLCDSDSGESLVTESDEMDDFVDVDDAEHLEPEVSQVHEDYLPRKMQDPLNMHYNSELSHPTPELEKSPFAPAPGIFSGDSRPDPGRNSLRELSFSHERPTRRELARKRRSGSDDSVIGRSDVGDIENAQEYESPEVIDLTRSTPSPRRATSADDLFTENERDRVENSTSEEIAAWDWRDLDEQSDRKRIILKRLQCMDENPRKKLQLYLVNKDSKKLKDEVQRGLGAIKRGNTGFIQDVDARHSQTVIAISKLFVCWNDGCHRHFDSEIPTSVINPALKAKDFLSFYNFVKSVSAIANESDSEGDDPSPRKRRKNKVLKDRRAQALRNTAQARRAKGEVRSLKLKTEMASSEFEEFTNKIVVNTMKEEDEDLIFLNKHISERVKPHQIDGIRFLWREIVSVGKSSVMQGCLLAHTMGLGKTMQTISLLVTIAEAATSSNPRVEKQISASLRQSRTLILCPAGLVENWKDEFQSWLPPGFEKLGPIFDISSQIHPVDRFGTVSTWFEGGGILLIGYEMFRHLVLNSSTGPLQISPFTEVQQHRLREYLLDGPNIVVADEAHKLKHRASAISQAAAQFRTPSRIALTGSPLANNLRDYYTMIDWVADGYLGDLTEFKADYQEPIEAGTYADSTINEQRRSLKKLRALIFDIEPKVNRADISAIQRDLKPKTEFVIKLPLTPWQSSAYAAFVKSVLTKSEHQIVQAKLFDWMNFLSLLCTHPSIFLKKLLERADTKADRGRAPNELDGIETPPEGTTQPVIISNVMAESQRQISKEHDVGDIYSPVFSCKTRVIAEILLQSKRLGDRVLVFSQHLPTLDYLERFIKNLPVHLRTVRLDGSTKVEDRVRLVKDFNSGNRDIFLISTQAGGLGLNISGANRVILVDFSFNPSHEEQAVGRAYRIGQQKGVFVYHLVTGGTYEEILHNITIFKRQLAARVVDKKNPMRSASKGVVYLFEPKEVEQEDLDVFKGKDEIMDRLLEGEVGCFVRGLKTAETMHAETKEELTEEEEREVEEMIAADKRKKDPEAWEKMRLAEQTLLFDTGRSQNFRSSLPTIKTQTGASRYPQPAIRDPSFAKDRLLVQKERFDGPSHAVIGSEKVDDADGKSLYEGGKDLLCSTLQPNQNNPVAHLSASNVSESASGVDQIVQEVQSSGHGTAKDGIAQADPTPPKEGLS